MDESLYQKCKAVIQRGEKMAQLLALRDACVRLEGSAPFAVGENSPFNIVPKDVQLSITQAIQDAISREISRIDDTLSEMTANGQPQRRAQQDKDCARQGFAGRDAAFFGATNMLESLLSTLATMSPVLPFVYVLAVDIWTEKPFEVRR